MTMPSDCINVLLTAWCLTWILETAVSGRLLRPRFHRKYLALYALALIYLLMAISLLYTENTAYAARQFEKRLTFVFLPLMAVFGFSEEYERPAPFIKAFIAGNVVSLLVSMLWPAALLLFTDTFDGADNVLWKIRELLSFNYVRPTELGIFALAGWLCGIYLYRSTPASARKLKPVAFQCLWGGYGLVVCLWMWLLSCRMNMLLSGFFLVFMLIKDLWRRHRLTALLLSVAALTACVVVFTTHPRFQNLQPGKVFATHDFSEQEQRLGVWHSAVRILEEDRIWLTGVGTGDVKDRLMEEYQRVFTPGSWMLGVVNSERTHVHNNFLLMALETGLAGVLVLLFLLVWPLVRCTRGPGGWLVVSLWLCMLLRMLIDAPFLNLREIAGFGWMWLFFTTFDDTDSACMTSDFTNRNQNRPDDRTVIL